MSRGSQKGCRREDTDTEIQGTTGADAVCTAVSGFFGALPNTFFSQNAGLIEMTGVMSHSILTIGALFLILCGVIVMFLMAMAAGVSMLSDVDWGGTRYLASVAGGNNGM